MVHTARKLAELRGGSYEEISNLTTENFRRLLLAETRLINAPCLEESEKAHCSRARLSRSIVAGAATVVRLAARESVFDTGR